MESDAERRRRLARLRVQRQADGHRHNLTHASVSQPLIVAASRNHPLLSGVTVPVSWLLYEYSDQMLTDVGTQCSSSLYYFPQASPACIHMFPYTATIGASQFTYHCVQCPVECLTELPGWLDPSPLLILIHPKITSDCDRNHTGSSPLLD